MSSHLRRVLLAKNIVNSRNPKYTSRKQNKCGEACNRSKSLDRSQYEDIIDKLAYDTEHYPLDILKINCSCQTERAFSTCHGHKSITCEDFCCNYGCHSRNQTGRTSLEIVKTGRSETKNLKMNSSSKSGRKQQSQENKSRKIKESISEKAQCSENSNNSPRRRISLKGDNDDLRNDSEDNLDCSPQTFNPQLHSSANCTFNDFEKELENCKLQSSKRTKQISNEKEDSKYAKFVYDITQEIMQNSLYTDEDLQSVFRKHIDKSSSFLEKGKMMYEIYQLKVSLNMIDLEADGEEMDYIYSYRFSNIQDVKPPTPPKILDDNKVVEKLICYQKQDSYNKSDLSSSNRFVRIIDANPDFLITEKDVLMTLIENKMEPKQAARICKNLLQKSRDTLECQTNSKTLDKLNDDESISNCEEFSLHNSICSSYPGKDHKEFNYHGKNTTQKFSPERNISLVGKHTKSLRNNCISKTYCSKSYQEHDVAKTSKSYKNIRQKIESEQLKSTFNNDEKNDCEFTESSLTDSLSIKTDTHLLSTKKSDMKEDTSQNSKILMTKLENINDLESEESTDEVEEEMKNTTEDDISEKIEVNDKAIGNTRNKEHSTKDPKSYNGDTEYESDEFDTDDSTNETDHLN